MQFTDMKLTVPALEEREVQINDELTLAVRPYLPISDKTKFVQFIVDGALDDTTGCFSPIRIEVYYAIAVCHWYAGIEFSEEDLMHIETVYDILELNGVTDKIMSVIPEDELSYMTELVDDTTKDISAYSHSAAGIIQEMAANSDGLNNQLSDIINQLKGEEGKKGLELIEAMVQKD